MRAATASLKAVEEGINLHAQNRDYGKLKEIAEASGLAAKVGHAVHNVLHTTLALCSVDMQPVKPSCDWSRLNLDASYSAVSDGTWMLCNNSGGNEIVGASASVTLGIAHWCQQEVKRSRWLEAEESGFSVSRAHSSCSSTQLVHAGSAVCTAVCGRLEREHYQQPRCSH